MSKITMLLIASSFALASCSLPFRTAKVAVPPDDGTPPVMLRAEFTVLGPGGKIYDLDEVSRVGRINVEHALSLNFVFQDRESGVRSVRLEGEFLLWCGSTGIGPEQRWAISSTNSSPPAATGELVRVTAGADKSFKISDAYAATACTNPPARYQDLRGTISVTATNYAGLTTSREFLLTLVPSPTGVTVLD